MEIGKYLYFTAFSVAHQFFFNKRKTLDFFQTKFVWVGAWSGLGLGLGLGAHNTGTTRRPHQIPRFLYFYLRKQSIGAVKASRLGPIPARAA